MAADKENTASGGTSAVKTSSTRPDRAGASDHSDATADQRTSQRDQRRKRAVMTSAVTTQLMIVLDMTIIAVALPDMQESLKMTAAERPWVVTAYTLAFGGLVLFGGRLTAILGIRRAYHIGLTGFAVSSLVAGIAPSFAVLASARASQGAFGALLAPTLLALLNATFTDRNERGRAFATLGATGGVGAATGLILGGALTDLLDWRWALYINMFIAVVAFLFGRRSLPTPRAGERSSALAEDVFGLALGCIGIFSLVFGFDQAERHSWGARSTVAWLAVGGALLVAFVVRERFAHAPVLPLWIVSDPTRAGSYLTQFMVGAGQMGAVVYITYYFQRHFDYSPMRTGLAMLPMVFGIVVSATVVGQTLLPRLGVKFMLPAGLAVSAIAFLILSRVTVDADYAQVALPGLIVLGLGVGCASPVAFNAGTRGVPGSRAGLASAVLNASQQIGSSLGVAALATYASQHARDYAASHAGQLKEMAAQALAKAQALPNSPEGKRIIGGLRGQLADQAQISAYRGGFMVLVWALAAGALLLAIGAAVATFRARRQAAQARASQP